MLNFSVVGSPGVKSATEKLASIPSTWLVRWYPRPTDRLVVRGLPGCMRHGSGFTTPCLRADFEGIETGSSTSIDFLPVLRWRSPKMTRVHDDNVGAVVTAHLTFTGQCLWVCCCCGGLPILGLIKGAIGTL